MRAFKIAVAILAIVFAGAVRAQDRLVVVELFTSQGCSSCPPADALLGELAATDPDVLPLALHVDYWDYIGWKDEFASPEHTKRQRGYAYAKGERTIYTPQMVVGGLDHVVGFKPMKLAKTIDGHKRAPRAVRIALTRQGSELAVDAEAIAERPGQYLVYVVRFRREETVDIRRGENAGHTLTYHNIVTNLDEVGRWNGQGAFATTASVPEGGEVAVLIQEEGMGPILAAARAE